jgi:hypothetical protein
MINLKEIERRVYTSYHQDGVIDVSIAFIVLTFGLVMAIDMAWMGGILAALLVSDISLYAVTKKVFTVPRIGLVKFASYRVKALITIALGVFSLSSLLGLVAFMQVEGGGTPLWLSFAIENSMLVVGMLAATFFSAVGYAFRIRRMYGYAFLTLTMFVIGYFLYFPLHYYLILLGALILVFGLAMLARFVRKHPLSAPDKK